MREPARARADQDLARRGGLLQARGDVDGLAGRERRLGVVGDDLARLDADARLEPEPVHGVEDRERRAEGALGVVLVRQRDAERGHDRVAGELLDDAAVRTMQCETWSKKRVTRRRTTSGSLRGDERGRVDEVDEEDGCELAFHSCTIVVRGGGAAHRRAPGRAAALASARARPKVFKAYDVRGVYGDELDEDGAYAIGRAYVEQFEPRAIAVGRDMRVSVAGDGGGR